MRIAIVYIEPEVTPAEEQWFSRSTNAGTETLVQDSSELSALPDIELIASSLAEGGHEALPFAATTAAALCDFLWDKRPQLVFNICDSFQGRSDLELNVAALFELCGVPSTGAPAFALGLAQNKALTKAVLGAEGIPSPAYFVARPNGDFADAMRLKFPLIVKPIAEDASIGIDDGAVVADKEGLSERVRFVWREFRQAALVEEFIDGREFHVSVLATSPTEFTTLPISEIAFDGLSEGRPRILGYGAKWDNDASFRQTAAVRCPAELDARTAQVLRKCALEAAKVIGIKDYGRVDIRLRASDNTPFVLEVNPNPDLSPECKFMRASLQSGRTYGQTICEIVERAIERSDGVTTTKGRRSSRRAAIKAPHSDRGESVLPNRRRAARASAVKSSGKRASQRLLTKAR